MRIQYIKRDAEMPQKISSPQPPHGFKRMLLRAPIWFYRIRLGWILGKQFLLLMHTGRNNGLPRQTVLEVVNYDDAFRLLTPFEAVLIHFTSLTCQVERHRP